MSPLTIMMVLAAVYLLLSAISFIVYAIDKACARQPLLRRIPEWNLHWLALLGGWPGAWLAQRVLRHKTMKKSFRRAFAATVLFNLSALIAVMVFVCVQLGALHRIP